MLALIILVVIVSLLDTSDWGLNNKLMDLLYVEEQEPVNEDQSEDLVEEPEPRFAESKDFDEMYPESSNSPSKKDVMDAINEIYKEG